MLSHEESTFDIEDWVIDSPIGSWGTGDGVTISVTSDIDVKTKSDSIDVENSLDSVYCLKVVTTGSDQSINYGTNNPVNNAIPVTSGLDYALSFYQYDLEDISVTITWHDYLGRIISISSGLSTVPGSISAGPWPRKYFTAEAPANSTYASFNLQFSSAATRYLDMVQFEQSSSVSTYVEPRGVFINLLPTKYNYLSNPSFEVYSSSAFANWTSANITVSQTDSSLNIGPGSEFMAVVTTLQNGSGGPISKLSSNYTGNLLTSKVYTFSVHAKSVAGTEEMSIAIINGTQTSTKTVTITEDWQRISVSINCVNVPTSLTVEISSAPGPIKNFYLDSAQLEEGAVATDYFDGDRTYDGAAWSDVHQQSPSVYYPSKELRLAHLMDSIAEYLPISTPYYVTFYDSDSFTGVALNGIS